jgi:hypothetical protein
VNKDKLIIYIILAIVLGATLIAMFLPFFIIPTKADEIVERYAEYEVLSENEEILNNATYRISIVLLNKNKEGGNFSVRFFVYWKEHLFDEKLVTSYLKPNEAKIFEGILKLAPSKPALYSYDVIPPLVKEYVEKIETLTTIQTVFILESKELKNHSFETVLEKLVIYLILFYVFFGLLLGLWLKKVIEKLKEEMGVKKNE